MSDKKEYIMFTVYELSINDSRKFPVYSHNDKFTCECWVENIGKAHNSYERGLIYYVIEEA